MLSVPCLQFARQELDRAAAVAAAAAATGAQDVPSPAMLQAANTAEHLVYWALEKAARKLGRLHATGEPRTSLPPTVADVLALPVGPATPEAAGADAAAPQAAAWGEDAAANTQDKQEEQLQLRTTRRDIFGDLGLVVVTLRRLDCRREPALSCGRGMLAQHPVCITFSLLRQIRVLAAKPGPEHAITYCIDFSVCCALAAWIPACAAR